ncbi:MAG: DNA replication and repair protein RecF [Eggerthellaceae bacterium]|nr:DNA replication and repair protein RecF [Eggerthellaceae bacterium]
MPLRITNINFKNFRSYEEFSLSDLENLTVIVGQNAVGKTNIIEGIGLLTSLTSFRSATSAELLKNGTDFGRIFIDVTDGNRQLRIELLIEKGKRSYKLNGKPKRITDLKGLITSVTFTPDDLELVKGSHGTRRRSVDILGSQLNKNYYQITKDFEKVIRHKNKLLKDDASKDLIDSINELLIKVGAQLVAYRSTFFQRLLERMGPLYSKITGSSEELTGSYTPSWILEDDQQNKVLDSQTPKKIEITKEEAIFQLSDSLKRLQSREISINRTLIGPHRDYIDLFINGMNSSIFASQGQQRSIVLAWKLAEAQTIEDMTGQLPILLLDDVMSELDEVRRQSLVNFLSDEIQTFITTANINYFDEEILLRANVMKIPFEE